MRVERMCCRWIAAWLSVFFFYSASAQQDAVLIGPYPEALSTWPFESDTVVSELTAFPMRTEGRLHGCGIEFALFSRDWVYRENQAFRANGSINYYSFANKVPALHLKLHVTDMENRDGMGWGAPGEVHFAYIQIDDLNLAASTSLVETSIDGSTSSLSNDEELSILESLASAGKIYIWFNRVEGGADVRTTIVLDDHLEQRYGFFVCLAELTEGIGDLFNLPVD